MMILETKILRDTYYINKFTELLDQKCLIPEYRHLTKDTYKTYIVKDWVKEGNINIHLIRKIGATRGNIQTDENNIIKDIEFYKETAYKNKISKIACYDLSCFTLSHLYIGSKIVWI